MTTETQPFTVRQSHLATFIRCPLSARYSLEVEAAGDFHSPEQARGVMAHRCQAEILRRMKSQGEKRIGIGAALAVAEEVMGQADLDPGGRLVLGPEQKDEVRMAIVGFARNWTWDVRRIMAIERRLFSTLRGPDGVERVLTGQPDVILAMPPGGAEIEDSKTGWGPPKEPRTDQVTSEKRYLSERGLYQLDVYGVLVMDSYPAIQRVRLTERHLMVGEERGATLERDELEEVKRRLAEDMMQYDHALHDEPPEDAGESWGLWQPIGGRWCSYCAGRMRCPRPAEDRREGAIIDLPMAEQYAQDLAKVDGQRDHILKATKAWVDAHGPIPMPDGRALQWHESEKDGKVSRRFKAAVPSENGTGEA
jgi:hypothetical protein